MDGINRLNEMVLCPQSAAIVRRHLQGRLIATLAAAALQQRQQPEQLLVVTSLAPEVLPTALCRRVLCLRLMALMKTTLPRILWLVMRYVLAMRILILGFKVLSLP
jgi:hypothetical protein